MMKVKESLIKLINKEKKEIEKNVDREKLIYETNEYTYSFKNFQTIKPFVRDICEGNLNINLKVI